MCKDLKIANDRRTGNQKAGRHVGQPLQQIVLCYLSFLLRLLPIRFSELAWKLSPCWSRFRKNAAGSSSTISRQAIFELRRTEFDRQFNTLLGKLNDL